MIVTPGHLRRRSEFYHQLSSLVGAGLSIIPALETVLKSPPSRGLARQKQNVLMEIQKGSSFTSSLAKYDDEMPTFDVSLLHAGEKSGRLDGCLKLLAGYYETQAKLLKSMISELAYPAFLVHAAAFILPFPQFFVTWDIAAYLAKILCVLLPVYSFVLFYAWASNSTRGEAWRSRLEKGLRWVPVLGTARQYLGIARFAVALNALLDAGVLVIESLQLAADASGSPALRRTVGSWKKRLEAGTTPGELISSSAEFPTTFASLYQTGEISGKLHDHLPRIYKYFEEEAMNRFHALAKWIPKIVYLGVAMVIAYRIVAGYQNYFKTIDELTK